MFRPDTAPNPPSHLSLHDALPISPSRRAAPRFDRGSTAAPARRCSAAFAWLGLIRGLEAGAVGTGVILLDQIGRAQSELQSRGQLVCRLLLEKTNKLHANNQDNYS